MSTSAALLNGSFVDLRKALDSGAVTSVALTNEALRRAHTSQPELNAFISLSDEHALEQAHAADARLQRGERAPLLGVPVGVKDMILVKGVRATAASKMLENFVAPYDATVVQGLRRAGAPMLGKLNLDEFAMGSSNEKSAMGPVRNPWDPSRVPGGSSGGSAAAVAARVVPLALGTDTGGSIRQPAALCGITGIKPTYGRVSRFGVVAFASSLDQVGPMGGDALACAAMLEAIAGPDTHDATCSVRPVPKFFAETQHFVASQKIQGLRIGVPKSYFGQGLNTEIESAVRDALSEFQKAGAQLVEIDLPLNKYAVPVYYLLATAEASSNLARYDGVHYGHRSQEGVARLDELYARSRAEGFGREVRLRILMGTYALSSGYYEAYFRKAAQVRALIKRDYERAFSQCDVIAGPTTPHTAFKLGEKSDDPLAMYLEDIYTIATNLAGLPGISLNCGFDKATLPIGLQLQAPWWEESRLLGMAALYQKLQPASLQLSPLAQRLGQGA